MSNQSSRARQPKGIPVGGQFSASTHAETDVVLGGPRAGETVYTYGGERGINAVTYLRPARASLLYDRPGHMVRLTDGTEERVAQVHLAVDVESCWHVVNEAGKIVAGGPGISEDRAREIVEEFNEDRAPAIFRAVPGVPER